MKTHNTIDTTVYDEFFESLNENSKSKNSKIVNGFFTRNNMIGKTVFNVKAKRIKYGNLYKDPIYHDFDYAKHPNQYEIRVIEVGHEKLNDKNNTTWWISENTNLDTELVITKKDKNGKIVVDTECVAKLKELQEDLKEKRLCNEVKNS